MIKYLMSKNFYHNYHSIDLKLKIKKLPTNLLTKKKITVDINKLLNRVKIKTKNEIKQKFIYLGMSFLVLGFMGIFISI